MQRALRMCLKPGCGELVKEGYCAKHAFIREQNRREFWRELDRKKPEWKRRFYASREWTEASIRHRAREPLCRRCKAKGMIQVANLTHHNPDLEALVGAGLNPFDDRYLESICHDHHQEELRKKRVFACQR